MCDGEEKGCLCVMVRRRDAYVAQPHYSYRYIQHPSFFSLPQF